MAGDAISETLIGFDSAWVDRARQPGAIAALHIQRGAPVAFEAPLLASFAQAGEFVAARAASARFVLVGIDQPTIVRNAAGSRPADRVAASVVARLKGGVQPANRSAAKARMFGDDAPIWRFLSQTRAVQNPQLARTAETGVHAMEVFPALSLPALVPELWRRRRGAKYNPASAKFSIADWRLAAEGLAGFAERHKLAPLAEWAGGEAARIAPRKADQDRLDAALCLAIVFAWRHGAPDATLQFGDVESGYIVGMVSPETRAALIQAAARVGAPIGLAWRGCALTGPPDLVEPAGIE